MRRTIIVSNRLPVSIKKSKKGLEFFSSSGGLVSAMESFTRKRGTTWIGWPGIPSDVLNDDEKEQITKKLKSYNCLPVFLSEKQVDEYYSGYSNAILWPLFHHLLADYRNETKLWKSYKNVNQLFADTISSASNSDTNIWIHDYQLMLTPDMVRHEGNSARIGFFLHIPFPEFTYLKKLKNHRQLVKGLLGADLIGFHTNEYVKDFINVCDELNLGVIGKDTIDLKSRVVQITDFPIGIDYKKFSSGSKKRSVKARARKLKRKYKDCKIIVTVDRLDPTKGFVERLKAYQQFLKENPSLRGKVVMMMLAIPSRSDVEAYKKLKSQVEKLVLRINEKYATDSWMPVDYMYTTVDFEQLSAMYSVADVAFVAPIKDGMNLVAKEFVASQHNHDGALILSETAGAAKELQHALLVNPKKPKSLVQALEDALKMPPKELKKSLKSMQEVIATNTNKNWADAFMNSLKATDTLLSTVTLNQIRADALQADYLSSESRLLIFDYDGVLSDFYDNPRDAKPTKEVLGVLEKFASSKKNTVAIISGRSKEDLQRWFGKLPITLGAEHGSLMRINNKWEMLEIKQQDWKPILKPILEKYARATPGAFVEDKQNSLVWHYRKSSPYYSQKYITIMKTTLRPVLKSLDIKLHMGNKIIEFKHQDVHKGAPIKSMLEKKPYDFVMILGDDYTDEEMFKNAPKEAYTIKVGPGRSAAKYRINTQSKVLDLLKKL